MEKQLQWRKKQRKRNQKQAQCTNRWPEKDHSEVVWEIQPAAKAAERKGPSEHGVLQKIEECR